MEPTSFKITVGQYPVEKSPDSKLAFYVCSFTPSERHGLMPEFKGARVVSIFAVLFSELLISG